MMTYVPEEEFTPSLDAVLKAEVGEEGGAEEASATEERKVRIARMHAVCKHA